VPNISTSYLLALGSTTAPNPFALLTLLVLATTANTGASISVIEQIEKYKILIKVSRFKKQPYKTIKDLIA
jgi:hypothetical protein